MPHSDDVAEELCPYVHINTQLPVTAEQYPTVNGLNNRVNCLTASEGQALCFKVSHQALVHMATRGEVPSESLNGEGARAKLS